MIRNNTSHKVKKVLVALSGGVDSAVAAALLKKRGLVVVGVFFDFGLWGDASKVGKIAKKLDITLNIVDARKDFKKKIINCFVSSYKKGITPNPCVICNREMKFDLLCKLLKKEKADYIATGHYARIEPVIASVAKQSRSTPENMGLLRRCAPRNDKLKLIEARDKAKDQSYFLYRLTQRELSRIIFPLGGYKKTETKKMAKKLGLPVVGDEESQDICFLLNQDINSFLKKFLRPKPGNIVGETGNVLAKHKGLPFYTIGQRKGIEIGPSASREQREAIRASGPGPYFVVRKNMKKNELIVSNDPKKLFTKKFEVKQANWINKETKFPLRANVQIRYHGEKVSAIIKLGKPSFAKATAGKAGKSDILIIETKSPVRAVTPGQSAVFYKKGEVLGGGVIC